MKHPLPRGWNEVKLKDIGEILGGGTPSTANKEYWNGDILWVTPTEVTALKTKYLYDTERKITELGLKNSSAKMIKPNSLIICTRATIGDCCINKKEISTNQGFKSITPNNNYDVVFLYYLINYNRNLLIANSSGSTFLEISKSNLENLSFYFPPLDEQKRIAEVLSLCDKLIENLTKLIEKKEIYKKGVMQRVLTGKVRFNGFTDEWETVRLGDIVEMSSGGTPNTKNKEYYNGNIVWVTIKDITSSNKFLYDSEKKITKKGLENSSAKIFPINTILYAMYASIGECIISKVECATSQAILGIECSNRINFMFLYYILLNNKNNAKKMRQTGTQPNLNKQIVSDFEFNIPSLEEQNKIAELLTLIDKDIEILKQLLHLRKLQKKGVMQKLLTGEVRL
ncbi:restriction endonuclease subunit S [Brachyspira pilosicoli]|uniref:restriction endonuclease subunit S n=1 Tax=Brachyspira pilosicoli TaxID=52584 RepID=UPI003007EFBA